MECPLSSLGLAAILLAENGRPTEQTLGIATIYDIPKMRRAMMERRKR
jgi:hypothetical protein